MFSFRGRLDHTARSSTHVVVGRADSDLAQVDGEDGVRSGALDVHLSAGRGAGQSTELQALHHLNGHRARTSSY